MKNILKNMVNRKVGNSEIVEVEQLNPEEEETMFLPIASEALNITEQYKNQSKIAGKHQRQNGKEGRSSYCQQYGKKYHGYCGNSCGLSIYIRCVLYCGFPAETGRH